MTAMDMAIGGCLVGAALSVILAIIALCVSYARQVSRRKVAK